MPCIKNCLMASTIVITAGVNVLPPNDDQVSRLCDSILESLSNAAVGSEPREILRVCMTYCDYFLDNEDGCPVLPLDSNGHPQDCVRPGDRALHDSPPNHLCYHNQ